MDLNKSIKTFNLVSTDTISRDTLCKVGFDADKIDVNYDNCVSLNEIKDAFIKSHKMFKEEYDNIEKFDLGEYVEINNYSEFDLYNEHYRVLKMYICNPSIINKTHIYLYLREIGGVIMPYIDNDVISFHNDYHKDIKLDDSTAENYLYLFKKYQPLLDFYQSYKLLPFFEDGTFSVYSKINSKQDNFLDDMDSMEFFVSSNFFMSPGDHIKIKIDAKTDTIDSENSYAVFGGKELEANDELYEKMLNEIFVNKKHLNYSLYRQEQDCDSFNRLLELKSNSEEKVKIFEKKNNKQLNQ